MLVLCPTRELAVQVCEELHRLSTAYKGFSAIPVYGGTPIDRQIRALRKGAHIVVGTPGRVMDHLERGTLKTDSIEMVILDEADRMLDMGFREDMEVILGGISEERQTLFFSATMNKGVQGLIKAFSRQAKQISIERKSLTVDSIEQTYYEVRNRSKIEVMSRLLDMEPTTRGIVFCNTKQMVEDACEALTARGYTADRIHGDISQGIREKVIRKFREGSVELLVATDVAARGLDIDDIDLVFNYDLPYDPEDYVHRIGRTGRAGRSGKSITFVYGRDIYRLEAIERYTRQVVRRMKIPHRRKSKATAPTASSTRFETCSKPETTSATMHRSTACSTWATPRPISPARSLICFANRTTATAKRSPKTAKHSTRSGLAEAKAKAKVAKKASAREASSTSQSPPSTLEANAVNGRMRTRPRGTNAPSNPSKTSSEPSLRRSKAPSRSPKASAASSGPINE